jgi:REP element-mobilizing transposase RayT
MLRGIDKRNIFLDDEDRMKFIEKLLMAKKTAGFKLYGYCLMDNHVHLLIGEQEETGISIKRITVGYVRWHNSKHERTGHLFQNRYMSEVVETEGYLINVLRYIHQKPVKAKITNYAKDYPWSS